MQVCLYVYEHMFIYVADATRSLNGITRDESQGLSGREEERHRHTTQRGTKGSKTNPKYNA